MKKYSIIWSPSFQKEFRSIYQYLFYELKVPRIARKIYEKIVNKILSLEYYPERYSKINISKDINLRKIPINKYVIIYEVDNNTRTSIYFTYLSW